MKFVSVVLFALGSYLLNANVAEAQASCWNICYPSQVPCPSGWHAQQLGYCWTCCPPPST